MVTLPPLPDLDLLADECLETAALERVQPAAVEKDFHLTRLIWGLAETCGDGLLLKGGTCLNKVDFGYRRMSEDADLVIPWSRHLRHRGINASHVNSVRDALRKLAPEIGLRFPNIEGERFNRNSHAIWELHYDGRFPPTTLVLEVSLRRVIRPPRRARLNSLLQGPLTAGYGDACCFALDADEVRAEKVRAAFTRETPEIRDFYDLEVLAALAADLTSPAFVELVDQKLAEMKRGPLADMPPSFGLTPAQRAHLSGPGLVRLAAVIRTDEPAFDLERMLARFNQLWQKPGA
ncbi:MAG: nucleotidyl transferase AbiEii/AbiGii toxin family protein [Chloroflexi bacterium]|nr:nucleotidyl transferase AbiEii/AbiGii toxin family protein [Chloroflexota bacterium]